MSGPASMRRVCGVAGWLRRGAWLVLAAAAGCGSSGPPQFALNLEGRDPAKIKPRQTEELTQALGKLFGTPDEPRLPEAAPLDLARLKTAAGPIGSDEQGRAWGLFRKHCVGCHGVSGDGAGPNAAVLSPYPRDFRNGVFKYTSTAGGAKPVRGDLARTLYCGVPGTAMPSFRKLDEPDRDSLLEYVQYLGIRGETELWLLQRVVDEDEYPVSLRDASDEAVQPAFAAWQQADAMVVAPPPPPPTDTPEHLAAAIARGRELYATQNAQCVKCHGPDGKGDGEQSDDLYDDWNKRKKGVTPEQTAELERLFRLPLQRLRARNFAEGVFQGGDRPIDFYWRIHVGLKGTPMPAAGPAPGAAGALKPDEIWNVVYYVQSLAAPRRR